MQPPLPRCAPPLETRLTTPRWLERWRAPRPTPATCALALWECCALAGRQARWIDPQGPGAPLALTSADGHQWSRFAMDVLQESLLPAVRDRYQAELIHTLRHWAATGVAHGDWGVLQLSANGRALEVAPRRRAAAPTTPRPD